MDKVENAKRTLRLAVEMSEHYYHAPLIICYSGGKDSDVILRLAMETLTPDQYEVLHSITTVDSPITNKYVNDIYKELKSKGIKAEKNIPVGPDGKPTHMWKLIVQRQMPPTRLARYCCQVLKEVSTPNRIAVLGVRQDESSMRKGRDVFGIRGETKKDYVHFSVDHTEEVFHEGLEKENEVNGEAWDCTLIKNMKLQKDAIVNLIYEWSDEDVWNYLRSNNYPHNPMYEMGYHRVGCVGCPMATYKQKKKEFSDFPGVKNLYIKAFDEMLKVRHQGGKTNTDKYGNNWKTGKDVYDWWVQEFKYVPKGQMTIMEYMEQAEEKTDEFGLIVRKKNERD